MQAQPRDVGRLDSAKLLTLPSSETPSPKSGYQEEPQTAAFDSVTKKMTKCHTRTYKDRLKILRS